MLGHHRNTAQLTDGHQPVAAFDHGQHQSLIVFGFNFIEDISHGRPGNAVIVAQLEGEGRILCCKGFTIAELGRRVQLDDKIVALPGKFGSQQRLQSVGAIVRRHQVVHEQRLIDQDLAAVTAVGGESTRTGHGVEVGRRAPHEAAHVQSLFSRGNAVFKSAHCTGSILVIFFAVIRSCGILRCISTSGRCRRFFGIAAATGHKATQQCDSKDEAKYFSKLSFHDRSSSK